MTGPGEDPWGGSVRLGQLIYLSGLAAGGISLWGLDCLTFTSTTAGWKLRHVERIHRKSQETPIDSKKEERAEVYEKAKTDNIMRSAGS